MLISEFRALVEGVRRAHPTWFDLPTDQRPSDAQIADHQERLGVTLPEAYVDFVKEFGGGDFAFLRVYSMDVTSDLNIVVKNDVDWLRRSDFIAVSDNGCGDYYGFPAVNGKCSDTVVLLDHESGEVSATDFGFLTFVARVGMPDR